MIKIENLYKQFDIREVIKDLSLEIPTGQITCIIGRSGEGKSILLKQIIGLIRPTSGKIFVDGQDIVLLKSDEIDENFKRFGYVFQFAALLDSLTVFQNIGVTLLEHGMSEEEVLPIVKAKLRDVDMQEDALNKYPSELSGGMRKRVGLARTLLMNPQYMLYDEPTTGLDPITSHVIHRLIYNTQKRLNITSVIVTHDLEFFKYADNVALLYEGKIVYFGSAKTVWESDNPYIYQFIRGLTEGPIKTEVSHRSGREG
ncbi:MAG: ATP-binding cassette domain-containing protein [Candidatus Babeliales bacterium]